MSSEPNIAGRDARPQPPAMLWPGAAPEPETSSPWVWLVPMMIVAAALRGIALNQQLWYDEITTLIESVRTPLGQIVTTYTSQNQHILYSVLARLSIVAFGDSVWALRLPAVIFGVLCVPALYFCARLWVTRREALLACALLMVSYHHVWFSQNARGYTGLAFFTLASTYCFVRGAQSRGWKAWAGYGVAVALGMYTHLSMGFIAAGQGFVYLWMLWARRKELGRLPENAWTPLVGFIVSGALAAMLYAPVMKQMLNRTVGSATSRGAAEVVKAEWRSPLWLALETLRGLAGNAGLIGIVAVLAGAVILLLGVWSLWRAERFAVGLIFFPIIVTALITFALSRNLWPRFFFFAIGFGLLLLVRGASEGARLASRGNATKSEQWSAVLVAMILLGFFWQLRAAYLYPKQDFLGAMKFVDALRGADDAVALVGLTVVPYQKYYGRDWPQVETPAQLAALGAGHRRVWMLYTLPIYVESRYPALWNILKTGCPTQKIFRGTMGGGEIYVCRVEDALQNPGKISE